MAPRRQARAQLHAKVYLREEALSVPVVQALMDCAQTGWGRLAEQVTVTLDEALPAVELTRSRVTQALGEAGARGMATLSFPGRPGLNLFVMSDKNVEYPPGNTIGLEVLKPVQEDPGAIESFLGGLCARLACTYGHAESDPEFRFQNIDRSGGGLRAVGVNLLKSLPGVYWLNYFGAPYLALRPHVGWASIGGERLGEGVLVRAAPNPYDWDTPEGRQARSRIRDVVGRELFFDRSDPGRATVAIPYSFPRQP